MPKVQHIKRAGKDYPQFGIKKGDEHYVWSMKMQRGGVVRRSKTYPRPSQLTLSDYKVQAHQLNEQIEDFQSDDASSIEAFRDELVSDAESLRDEQQEKYDNMPEGLQAGPTGEQINERIEAMDAFIDALNELEFDEFEQEDDEEDDEGNCLNVDGETEAEYGSKLLEALKEVTLDVG